MSFRFKILLLAITLCFITPQLFGQPAPADDERSYFSGQLYVKFSRSSNAAAAPLQQLKGKLSTRSLVNQARIRRIESIVTSSLQRAADQYMNTHPGSSLRRNLHSLQRVYHIEYSGEVSPLLMAAKLERRSDIEYASPRYYHHLVRQPNDPLQDDFLEYHNFYAAWDQSTGSEDVIIGIVDSGVDYTHEDLRNEIWVNENEIPDNWQDSLDSNGDGEIYSGEIRNYLVQNGEDFNGDGTIDLQDALADASPLTTGSDFDDNGYPDDLFGWDYWQSGQPGDNLVSDNNPIGDFSFHGTHVGGIAGAESDNATGITGTGYNSRIMPVKAGGIKDIPDTQPDETKIIGFGYEGMLYAAMNGADIINASWGGGAFSDFEYELLQTISELNVLIVAASGNRGRPQVIYPAAFPQTLAVGSVEPGGQVSGYSNYGYSLDVLATGSGIISTMPDNDYERQTGTSMSTPVVSGLAALLKSRYPSWSGQRIRQQIRVSSERIDNMQSDDRQYQLGHGKINAEQTLLTPQPGLKVLSSDFLNDDGEKLNIDESGRLQFTIANYGASATDINMELEARTDNLTISSPQKQGMTVTHNDTVQLHFDIRIESDYNINEHPSYILHLSESDGPYSDFHHVVYEDILYDEIAVNEVYTSFAANGTVGFTNALFGTGGVGFQPRYRESGSYETGPNLLFEGGLVSSFDGIVQDAVRSQNGQLSRDFRPLSTFRILKPGAISDADGQTRFKNYGGSDQPFAAAQYRLHTYAFDDPSVNQTIIVRYDIKNTTFDNRQLRNVYIGLFNDWDLGSVSRNSARYIMEDSLLYVYDEADQVPYYVGVAPLNKASSQFVINNPLPSSGPDSLEFGIYDGFSDDEKQIALRAGRNRTNVTSTDVSTMVATGPYHIGPRSEITVGFVYGYGHSLKELRSQISAARQRNIFRTSDLGLHTETADQPEQTKIYQNYPNPFNSRTNIRIDLAESQRVTAVVYNVLGQQVATLRDRQMSSGIHLIQFSPDQLSSGLYLVDIKTEDRRETLKINLLK